LGDVINFEEEDNLDHPMQSGLSNNGIQKNGLVHLELPSQGEHPSSGISYTSSETPLIDNQNETQNEENYEPIPFLTLQDEDISEDPKEQFSFSLDIPEVEPPATTPQQPTVDFSSLTDSEVLSPEPEEQQVEFLLWGISESCDSENVYVLPIEQLSETHNNLENNNFTLGNDIVTESTEISQSPPHYHITELSLTNEQTTTPKMKKKNRFRRNGVFRRNDRGNKANQRKCNK